jgi:multiple sugar transport system substrate-binding protein
MLAACDIGGSSSPTTVTSTSKKGGITVINFFTTEDDPATQQVTLKAIADFEAKNPDYRISQILMSNADRDQRVITGLTIGQDMGIFEVGPNLRGAFVDSGKLYPMDSLIKDIGATDFTAGSRVVANGHDWAFPYAVSVQGMWGRTDRVPVPPKNFDDFIQVLKDSTHGSNYGYGISSGGPGAFLNMAWPSFLYSHGGDRFDPEGNVVFGSPAVTQAIQDWLKVYKYAPQNNSNWAPGDYLTAYFSGRVAIAAYPGRLGASLHTKAPALDPITWYGPTGGILGPQNVAVSGTSYLAIDKSTADPEKAMEFIKFLLTGDNGLAYASSVPLQLLPAITTLRNQWQSADTAFAGSPNRKQWVQVALAQLSGPNLQVVGAMGALATGTLIPSNGPPPPWSTAAFGLQPPEMLMIQHILNDGWSVSQAQSWAVDQFKAIVKAYKAAHPSWKPYSG